MYLKLKNNQLIGIPIFILCDGLKNNTILLGADVCKGWHSRYWGEYKGHNDVEHDELSVQSMIETHKKYPHVSSMKVNKYYKLFKLYTIYVCYTFINILNNLKLFMFNLVGV